MATTFLKPHPNWEEHEKPSLPGSPSTPNHTLPIRLAYGLVAILVGLTGALGNALVTVNLSYLQGELGLTPREAAWLPAAYAMVYVTANLLIIKFRQQYGMRLFTEIGLGVYALLAVLHLWVDSSTSMLLLRGASGFAGATAITLCLLYMLQAFPKRMMGKALVIGLSISQLAVPVAWIVSPMLIDLEHVHGLYAFEAGLALCSLAAVIWLKLPPGYQIKTFEKLDFYAFLLFSVAIALLVAFLTQGYIRWWLNDTDLAWMLIGSVSLFGLGFFIEYHRDNPLVKVRWLLQGGTIRFFIGALLLRFITAEQNYGMVSMLRMLGMDLDQMQSLYVFVLFGVVCGMVFGALTFGKKTVILQILIAILLIGIAGFLDFGRTSLDRPHDFIYSQFVLSIGAGMFMGPLVLIGAMQALKHGADHIVTFAVLVSFTQILGGVIGTATLSTFQQYRLNTHHQAIVSHLTSTDPLVAERLRLQAGVLRPLINDPVMQNAQGTAQLASVAIREANVRAYNDVFLLSGVLAILFLIWSLILAVFTALKSKKSEPSSMSFLN